MWLGGGRYQQRVGMSSGNRPLRGWIRANPPGVMKANLRDIALPINSRA